MKNKNTKVFYILFFIIAAFFAAFVLAEFRDDYIAIGLSAVVMLIAAYFLVDKIERDIYTRYEEQQNDMDQRLDAILSASLQGLTNPKDCVSELSGSLSEVEKQLSKEADRQSGVPEKELLRLQQQTIQLLKDGFIGIINFSKENARQVALNTNQNTEKLLQELTKEVTELMGQVNDLVKNNLTDIQENYNGMSDAYLENTSVISKRLEEIENITEEIKTAIHQ